MPAIKRSTVEILLWDAGRPEVRAPYRHGHETQRVAAGRVAPRAKGSRLRVLEFIRAAGSRGATIEELALGLEMKESSVCGRRSELGEMGLVVDSGRRRPTSTGADAIVWVLTTEAQRTRSTA